MTPPPAMLDELRLLWMEERDFLETIRPKRPVEEVRRKQYRLDLLEEIGREWAALVPLEPQIKALRRGES